MLVDVVPLRHQGRPVPREAVATSPPLRGLLVVSAGGLADLHDPQTAYTRHLLPSLRETRLSATEAAQLAPIQQTAGVYVHFTQSNSELFALRKALASGQLRRAGGEAVAVNVLLEDGSVLPQPGRLRVSELSEQGLANMRVNPTARWNPGSYAVLGKRS